MYILLYTFDAVNINILYILLVYKFIFYFIAADTHTHTHTHAKDHTVFFFFMCISFIHHFNTVNKSECIKHVVFECALNVLSWDVATFNYNC